MPNFIYVFSEEGRDMLLVLQYEMLECDNKKHIYVFLNKECQDQDFTKNNDFKFVLSDTLTF